MPTIAERLNTDIIAAMKSHADDKLTTLRMAKAAIRSKEIDKREPLTEPEQQAVLQTMLKQRRESAEQFTKGGRPELAEKERAEIGMLEDYLPKQAQEDDIRPIILGALAHVAKDNGGQRPGPKDMGPVMRTVQMRIATSGLYVDTKTVSQMVKAELSKDGHVDPDSIADGGFYGG